MFDSLTNLSQLFSDTIIMYRETPIYIRSVNGSIAIYHELGKSELKEFNMLRNKKHISPVKLGWVNYPFESLFASRKPVRLWKQGLHRDNFLIGRSRTRDSYIGLNCPYLEKTIKGEFPSWEEAFNKVIDFRISSCAPDRIISLRARNEEEVSILARKTIIGSASRNNINLSNSEYEKLLKGLI